MGKKKKNKEMFGGSERFPEDYRQFGALSVEFFHSVKICRRSLVLPSSSRPKFLIISRRSETLRALGAKSGAVPVPKILFASVYTGTSRKNYYTLYNKTCRGWSVFVEVF